MFSIRVLNSKAVMAMQGGKQVVDRNFSKMIDGVARSYRDKVRENIKTEGETFDAPWAELSKWTIAKKGSKKALAGEWRNVQYRVRGGAYGEVFHRSTGNWSINQHHEGFTTAPTGARVTLNLKRPSVLSRKPDSGGAYRWNTISFIDTRGSHVPARRIWATRDQIDEIAAPFLKTFLKNTNREIAG